MGASWKEKWDGVGWNVVRRQVSLVIVVLFVLFLLSLSGFGGWWYVTQGAFGIEGMVLLGIALTISLFALRHMMRSTYFRFDADKLLIEQRPQGRVTRFATRHIERFVVIDQAARAEGQAFSVYCMPVEVNPQRLDVDLDSAAEARYVMTRFNEMLAQVRNPTAS
jgi:hypothetical protein